MLMLLQALGYRDVGDMVDEVTGILLVVAWVVTLFSLTWYVAIREKKRASKEQARHEARFIYRSTVGLFAVLVSLMVISAAFGD